MGVGITLGDVQSHSVTGIQGMRDELAVLRCPVTEGSGRGEAECWGEAGGRSGAPSLFWRGSGVSLG